MYGPKFAKESDETKIDDTIRDNVNIISPEIGAKIDRLMKLAREEGVNFEPSEKHKLVREFIKLFFRIIRNIS